MHIYLCAKSLDNVQMDIKQIRLRNLRALLKDSGQTAAEFAFACGSSPSTFSQILSPNATRGLGDKLARQIEEHQGLAHGYLDVPHTLLTEDAGNYAPDEDEGLGLDTSPLGESQAPQFVNLPVRNAQLSAGNGSYYELDQVTEYIPVSVDYLIQHHIDPGSADIVRIKGDSMERTLFDGDTVIVDRSQTKPVSGRVYAFTFDDELRVKRFIKRMDGSWEISSDNKDNPDYRSEFLSHHNFERIRIRGRVMRVLDREVL